MDVRKHGVIWVSSDELLVLEQIAGHLTDGGARIEGIAISWIESQETGDEQ